ncbi:MAG TPA: M20/M25/M40 family metallo-hydrolase [Steroidobacteraceae bacterium]|nr:M20/M25/M40 family metallo-hydrolase [Steroidobacteraceae bacterium]
MVILRSGPAAAPAGVMVWLLSAAVLAPTAGAAEKRPAAETAVLRAVDQNAAASEALLEQLVNINSGTFHPDGVISVAKVLEQELKRLGFQIRWIDEESVHRAPSLLAAHPGAGRGKRVLLIGHMDTVFEPSDPFQRFTRNGKLASGPGVTDMKGGLVVMVASLQALSRAGQLADASIRVFLTGDEEAPGEPIESARRDLVAAAKDADAALSFEGEVIRDGVEYASVARRGATQWELHVKAAAAHSGGIFTKDTGDGAAFEVSRILAQFHDSLREPDMTYSVGLLLAGSQIRLQSGGNATVAGKSNIVPPEALAVGDLRVLTPEQLRRVEQKMQTIVAASLPGTQSRLTFDEGYPPMAPTAGNLALLHELDQVSRSLGAPGIQALDPMLRGAGDASFIAPYIDVLDGLGLAGGGAHTAAEHADLSYLPLQSKRIALLVYRLSRMPRESGGHRTAPPG